MIDQTPRVQRYFDGPYHSLNFERRSRRALFRRDEDAIVRHARALIEPWAPRSVLDVGCGAGRLLAELSLQHPLERAAGVELATRTLEVARARLAANPEIVLEHASMESCQSLDSRFEVVTCIGLFDYVPFREAQLGRLLAAAERAVVVTAPCRRVRAQRLARVVWLRINGVRLQTYSASEVAAVCTRAGGQAWTFEIARPRGLEDNHWIVGRRSSGAEAAR